MAFRATPDGYAFGERRPSACFAFELTLQPYQWHIFQPAR